MHLCSFMKIPAFKDLIILEDEHFIFVNKPAGLSSLDERVGTEISLLKLARKYWPEAQLCHRLDRETSGVLLVAKHNEAYKTMALLFEGREVEKSYHAVVQGFLQVVEKSILLPLSITAKGLAKVDLKEGKKAETIITSIQHFNHYTLLNCKPITGRLHQIRVHLASQNFPIVSDETYGGKKPFLSKLKRGFKTGKWETEKPMMQRVALHAYMLKFKALNKVYSVIAPYPKDLEVLIKLLKQHDTSVD
jgi:RluA family pseudouridine synthase